MEISSINPKVDPSKLPLERLAGSGIGEREKIAEASRQFESVLLKQILEQAQRPMFKSNLMNGGGASSAIYQDLVTQQLADRMSQGGSFGFAKVLEKELTARYAKEPEPANTLEPAKPPQRTAQPGKRI